MDKIVKPNETLNVTFDTKPSKLELNDSFSESLSNALSEAEIGIDNNYILQMQQINEKRKEVLKNKERRRLEMAEHRYLEAMLERQQIEERKEKRKFSTYSVKPSNNEKRNKKPKDNENNSSNSHSVLIENLSQQTNEFSISAICQTVGSIRSCSIELANGKRKAIANFVSKGDAAMFQRRFNNFKLDSNLIKTRML